MDIKDYVNKFVNSPWVFAGSSIITFVVLILGFLDALKKDIAFFIALLTIAILIIISIISRYRVNKIKKNDQQLLDELSQLKKSNCVLESLVEDGRRIIHNKANIIIDAEKMRYTFEFEKKFEIISDSSPNFINGQFYCNKFLGNKDEAIVFYNKNKVKWKDLKFCATIQYRIPEEGKGMTRAKKVIVVPVTDCSNHIPYRIYYQVEESGVDIPTEVGTIIILKYRYEISANLWGSYLNRTLSYFQEDAEVTIVYPAPNNEELSINVSSLNERKENKPEELDDRDVSIKTDDWNHSEKKCTIKLPNKQGKYRIHWQTEGIFDKIKTTKNLADDLEVTNR